MPLNNPARIEAGAGGHVVLLGTNYSSIGVGTWALNVNASHYLNHRFDNVAARADGDNISWKVFLAAGNYTLRMIAKKTNNSGISDIDFNGVEVGSFDWYAAASADNFVQEQTAIAVAATELVTVRLRVDGKNGASGNYEVQLISIGIWRTS